ncbi:MAG: hypothetical protein WD928_02620 [Gammaproteobacteria bacterium]
MTCCIIALALVYQLLAAWRWMKRTVGIRESAPRPPRAPGLLLANLALGLRRSGVRVVLVAVLSIEGAVAGAYVFEHRNHIGNEVARVVFDATGLGFALCRDDRDALAL